MPETPSLTDLLRALEATEANIVKLERLWAQMWLVIPKELSFVYDPEYERVRRLYAEIVPHLPSVDGWRLEDNTLELNTISQMWFDAHEVGEFASTVTVMEEIERPGRELAEYRFRFDQKRRSLVRVATLELISAIDEQLNRVDLSSYDESNPRAPMPPDTRESLQHNVEQIDVLLGSSVKKPPRWGDLQRHLAFGMMCDLRDIIVLDWPVAKPALEAALYGEDDPLPVPVADLGSLTIPRTRPAIPTRLEWARLNAEDFERLIFVLLSGEPGYENPEWLTHTSAPDRGRDLSVTRVTFDSLSGTRRERVLVQCKHWLNRTIGVGEIATLKEQMRLWEPPRVDLLIIATTGRFSTDAIRSVETQNASDSALRIEMWPESHIERLLATRPGLIAEFGLR